jgi:coenzyme F420 biosynthesis associated uncharacterized protein
VTTPERRGFVDWGLAERVGLMIAGDGEEGDRVRQIEIDEASEDAVELVRDYTGFEPEGDLPRPEVVGRAEWVRANLATIRDASAELEGRVAESLDAPGPLGPAARAAVGVAAGAEAGLGIGYVGRRVLGQYDVALIGPPRPPRLLFVAPNLTDAQRRLGLANRDLFLRWIALHETTHAVQFGAVPWLRDHIGGMVERLLREASVRPELRDVGKAARGLLASADPSRVVEALREQGLVGLLAGPRRLAQIRELQATMTIVEGYCEHVMDAIGDRLDPEYARLRELADARRESRGRLDAIIAWLLGLDMKLRQYRVGKRFADSVAERDGIEGLNEVWRAPEALPRAAELDEPELWIRRVREAQARGSDSPARA